MIDKVIKAILNFILSGFLLIEVVSYFFEYRANSLSCQEKGTVVISGLTFPLSKSIYCEVKSWWQRDGTSPSGTGSYDWKGDHYVGGNYNFVMDKKNDQGGEVPNPMMPGK